MKKTLIYILTIVTLIFLQNVIFAQAPNLRAASSFALFTANGAFTNVGNITSVTGDVGTNVGEFNAFPPGTLVGQKHVANPTSTQVALDIDSAYGYLNGIACDSVIGTPLENQILTPKVYCLGGASALNGDLILDGQGNSNALFIFKIDGALSVSKSSNVILINSASLENVYWHINGAFNLEESSVFRGTIIANGAINLLEGSSLEGRGLSRSGAINTYLTTVKILSSALPIVLLSFSGSNKHSYNLLSWSTASETNNNYFTLEKTADGENFMEVSKISGAGNSDSVLYYTAIDYNPCDYTSIYRLKQTDFDGIFSYSKLVAVDFEKPTKFSIFPNPFSSYTTVTISEASQINNAELRIYNILGAEIMNIAVTQTTTLETGNFPSGIYFYKIYDNNKEIQSGRLVSRQ